MDLIRKNQKFPFLPPIPYYFRLTLWSQVHPQYDLANGHLKLSPLKIRNHEHLQNQNHKRSLPYLKLKVSLPSLITNSADLFSSLFRLCREIKSLNIRIRVLEENIQRSPKSGETVAFELGDSFISLGTYLDHEMQKSLSAWKEASKRLDRENQRCREMVKGNKSLESLYERFSLGILSDYEAAT